MNQLRINSREARTKWRDLLDIIQTESTEIIIERYGKPVGMLVPYRETGKDEYTASEGASPLKEAAWVYQTAVSEQLMNQKSVNLRQQLQQRVQALPHSALQAVAQFLKLVEQQNEPQPTAPVVSITAGQAAQWIGLLSDGYEGDAVADSEALYE